MPEIKNTFLKSKMNKDLDARLVPNGEYRDAKNVSVSRSEGSDVGSLENVLGNELTSDLLAKITSLEISKANTTYGLNLRPGEIALDQLEILGYYSATSIDKVFLFLTDYRDASNTQLENFAPSDNITRSAGPAPYTYTYNYKGSGCYIVEYNVNSNDFTVLVAGSFLNFSKTHPIINVNLLEDLLFWTDNRNQPRKINIKTSRSEATENGSWEYWIPGDLTISLNNENYPYYYNEDHISVAKFAPYNSISFLDSSNNSTLISNHQKYLPYHIVTKTGTSVTNPGVSVMVIDGNYTTGSSGNVDITPGVDEDILVVPQQTGIDGEEIYQLNGAVTPGATTSVTITGTFGITIPGGSTVFIARKNPDYNINYTGDENLSHDKFPKFSYRFKYDDDEYSLMAPFTQAAFVPNQFGYFVNNDEEVIRETGNVFFMENRVDQVKMNIDLPCKLEDQSTKIKAQDLEKELKIKEIQILVKNSDEQAVRVIDDVPVSRVASQASSNTYYEYDYLNSKPIKSLPEAELIRVHDKTPVRALAQEVVSNRVVYGNLVTNHASLDYIQYQLSYSTKANNNFTTEFPNHTVKQNRSYEVGIVLVDRYGRASNVTLADPSLIASGAKNSTIYLPYKNFENNSIEYWGHKLNLTLRQEIPNSDPKSGYPGLQSELNPLGYLTYRVVVKQQEQDYYNVYTAGALAGEIEWSAHTDSNATSINTNSLPKYIQTNRISQISLRGDNINKVPRDLSEVNSNDETFGSSVILFNRVNPIYDGTSSYNKQSIVSEQGEKVASIEPFKNLGVWTNKKGSIHADGDTGAINVWYPAFEYPNTTFNFYDVFFKASTNPFIATIQTDFKIGATPEYLFSSNPSSANEAAEAEAGIKRAYKDLGVFETKPTKSVLDIYWETSTSDLISVLNADVGVTTPVGVKDSLGNNTALGENIQYDHLESLNTSSSALNVTNDLHLVDASGADIVDDVTVNLISVIDGNGLDRTNSFQLNTVSAAPPYTIFNIQVKQNEFFVFNNGSNVSENYTFNLEVSDNAGTPLYTNLPIQISNCRLQNVAPIWNTTVGPSFRELPGEDLGSIGIGDVYNGSADVNRREEQLQFLVVDAATEQLVANQAIFVAPQEGSNVARTIRTDTNAVTGTYKIKAVDANGSGLFTYSNDFNVIFIGQ